MKSTKIETIGVEEGALHESTGWVAAGALAKRLLQERGVTCHAYVSRVGEVRLEKMHDQLDLAETDSNIVVVLIHW